MSGIGKMEIYIYVCSAVVVILGTLIAIFFYYRLEIYGVWSTFALIVVVALGVCLQWHQHIMKKNSPSSESMKKKNLFIETKNICDELSEEYKQLVEGKIELEFFRVNKRESLGRGACIPIDKPPDRRKTVDQCWLSIEQGRKGLLNKLNEIEFNFDVTKDLKTEMTHLRKSRYNDIFAIRKIRNEDTENCDSLRTWRSNAKDQGAAYLEKWFNKPYHRLLEELRKQF